jgi:hypothetical protein
MNTNIKHTPGPFDDSFNLRMIHNRQNTQSQLETAQGKWILLVGPREINHTMMDAIAKLAERGKVRVLDGGNRYNAYKVMHAAQDRLSILKRVSVFNAYSYNQVQSILEDCPSRPVPFVILDLLNNFYDDREDIEERIKVLRATISQIDRLAEEAGGVVSVHPPRIQTPNTLTLIDMLRNATEDTYIIGTVEAGVPTIKLV